MDHIQRCSWMSYQTPGCCRCSDFGWWRSRGDDFEHIEPVWNSSATDCSAKKSWSHLYGQFWILIAKNWRLVFFKHVFFSQPFLDGYKCRIRLNWYDECTPNIVKAQQVAGVQAPKRCFAAWQIRWKKVKLFQMRGKDWTTVPPWLRPRRYWVFFHPCFTLLSKHNLDGRHCDHPCWVMGAKMDSEALKKRVLAHAKAIDGMDSNLVATLDDYTAINSAISLGSRKNRCSAQCVNSQSRPTFGGLNSGRPKCAAKSFGASFFRPAFPVKSFCNGQLWIGSMLEASITRHLKTCSKHLEDVKLSPSQNSMENNSASG